MIVPPVHKIVTGVVAGTFFLLSQASGAIDVQVSGTVIVSIIGTIIGLLLIVIAWFARSQFEGIMTKLENQDKVMGQQGTKLTLIENAVQKLEDWKDERTKAHEEDNKKQVEKLEAQLAAKNKPLGG